MIDYPENIRFRQYYLVDGKTKKEIAELLEVSYPTVVGWLCSTKSKKHRRMPRSMLLLYEHCTDRR